MILVNVSARCRHERRRTRNEAFFDYLLGGAPELTEGIFINEPAASPPAPREEVGRGEIAGKPFRVLQPNPMPRPGERLVNVAASWAARLLPGGEDYVLLANSPFSFNYHVARALVPRAHMSIFDLSDDFSTWSGFGMEQRTRELVAAVDKVIYVNERTRERLPHRDGRVFVNGCDWPSYRRPPAPFVRPPFWPKPPGARYAGFVGGMYRDRMDLPLLAEVARRLPDVTFLFVGPGLYAGLDLGPANVHHAGEVAAEDLPAVVRSFDVGIVPFVVNALTDGSNLLKVLDYLAAGIPVVSTPCSGVERHGAAVRTAVGAEAFADAVAGALAGPHDPGPGLRIAEAMDWEPRIRELARWLFGRG